MKKLLILALVLSLVACSRDPKAVRDKYYKSAQEYLSEQKYEEAAIEFRNALRADNAHIASYMGLAKTLQQLDDQMGALAIFRRVNELDAANSEAKIELGRYMLAAAAQNPDLFKKAQQLAEETLKKDPSNVEARILLGNALAGLNDNAGSIRELEKALAGDPGNISASLLRGVVEAKSDNFDKAEQTFKGILKKHPESVQAHIAIASLYASRGKLADAEAQFEKAFDLDPGNPLGLYSLARFYLANKNVTAAENVFKEAIRRKPDTREPRWALANFYLMSRRTDEGLNILLEMVKKDPWDRQADLRRAEIYLAKQQHDEARKVVDAILAHNQNDAEARYLRARLLVEEGNRDKALEELDTALKHKGWLLPPYLLKATLLLDKGETGSAQDALNEVLKRDRQNLPARALLSRVLVLRQMPQDAIQVAEEVLRVAPGNEAALLAHADGLRATGKLERAKKDYVELCRIRPRNAGYRHRLGTVEVMQGDTASALAHFREALDLAPGFVDAVNDILYVLTKAGQYGQALAELDRLSKTLAPQDEIHRLRAQVYRQTGDRIKAEKELRAAVDLNPRNHRAYILLAQLEIGKKNPVQAVKELDRLILNNGKYWPAFLMKGYCLQSAGDSDGAVASYRKVLELNPENPVAANNLAWLLVQNNSSLEEALKYAKIAKKASPEDPEVADTLGWIYVKTKNPTLAVDQLLFSINNRKQPQAEHYYHLAVAYKEKGDLLLAKQNLRRSLDLDPKYAGALKESRELR